MRKLALCLVVLVFMLMLGGCKSDRYRVEITTPEYIYTPGVTHALVLPLDK